MILVISLPAPNVAAASRRAVSRDPRSVNQFLVDVTAVENNFVEKVPMQEEPTRRPPERGSLGGLMLKSTTAFILLWLLVAYFLATRR